MKLDKYARCIDCAFFGTHGAYCDMQGKQEICATKACVFFQWKQANTLQKMSMGYFFPFPLHEEERDELALRGMD